MNMKTFKDLTIGSYVYYVRDGKVCTRTVLDLNVHTLKGATFVCVTFVNGPTLLLDADSSKEKVHNRWHFADRRELLDVIRQRAERHARLVTLYDRECDRIERAIQSNIL